MCSYKKEKKSKSKESGTVGHPQIRVFKRFLEEKREGHRKHVKESAKQKLFMTRPLPVFCKSLNELKRLCKVPLIAIKQKGMGW